MSAGGSLPRYILQRLLLMLPMIWVLTTLVFLLLRVIPGDPISAAVGDKVSEEEKDARRERAGLDRPLYEQYFEYFGALLRLDFGTSLRDNRPVTSIILDNGGATLSLVVGAFVVALLIGIPLGLIAGRMRDSVFDLFIRVFGIVTYAAPVFWVGLLLILLVAPTGWPTADIAGRNTKYDLEQAGPITHVLIVDAALRGDLVSFIDIAIHHVLPCLVLGLLLSGVFIRLVRVNVLQTLKDDYIEAARARGISESRVLRKHAFRNALVPVITVVGLQAALALSGAVLTEQTFEWPGIGKTLIDYMTKRDYIAVQGIVTFLAVIVVVVSLIVDIINAIIDPRVRY